MHVEICICGHPRSQHGKWQDKALSCRVMNEKDLYTCVSCLEFKVDNLRTLEELSKED